MSGTLYLLPLLHAEIFVCLKLVQVMLSETLEFTCVLVLLYLAKHCFRGVIYYYWLLQSSHFFCTDP